MFREDAPFSSLLYSLVQKLYEKRVGVNFEMQRFGYPLSTRIEASG
jgi:hypothetical protein